MDSLPKYGLCVPGVRAEPFPIHTDSRAHCWLRLTVSREEALGCENLCEDTDPGETRPRAGLEPTLAPEPSVVKSGRRGLLKGEI